MTHILIPLRRKRDLECKSYCGQDGDTLMEHLTRAGYIAHPSDVAWAWYQHSDSMCATWMCVQDDEPYLNLNALLKYLEPNV